MTKYIIRRTSCWGKEKPHKDAVREKIDAFDVRTTSREDLRDRVGVNNWMEYENYTKTITEVNYDSDYNRIYTKKEVVYCRRPIKQDVWTIEVDDLEKLADEVNEDIIIFSNNDRYLYREIEIYDGYRE